MHGHKNDIMTLAAIAANLRRGGETEQQAAEKIEAAVRILREMDRAAKEADKLKPMRERSKNFRAVLHCDGASRGNPGTAGAGAVLYDTHGEVIDTRAVRLPDMTNNQAEYRAMIIGLEMALENGIGQIRIKADSELMVKQLNGQYKVKNEALKPLYKEATALLKKFKSWDAWHVPREQNAEADRLANVAIDGE